MTGRKRLAPLILVATPGTASALEALKAHSPVPADLKPGQKL
jgi:hypothetical protein